CTNCTGMNQLMNNKKFEDFPYGKLNAKMRASISRMKRVNCLHEYRAAHIGESSSIRDENTAMHKEATRQTTEQTPHIQSESCQEKQKEVIHEDRNTDSVNPPPLFPT
ncbi:hypothetical protein MKX03_015186, partial [Papaver bracteatum]